jgi:hypothetical protein
LVAARASLSGATPVTATSASGNATWITGGDRLQGSFSSEVKGRASRLTLDLGAVQRVEVRNDLGAQPAAQWLAADGKTHNSAPHNCYIAPAIFSPALLLATTADVNAVLKYVGKEDHNGFKVDHIRYFRVFPNEKSTRVAQVKQQMSAFDLYLDQSSHIPLSASYAIHPDDDFTLDIPVEVRFSDYRIVSGVLVPQRVQRFMNGVLNLDLAITNTAVNPDISDTQFSLQ